MNGQGAVQSDTAADDELIRSLLDELQLDALLVTNPANVRYLSGFTTPKDGRVLLTRGGSWLSTDARYDVQAAEESRLPVDLRRDWIPWVAEEVSGSRFGIEADALTHAQYLDLSAKLSSPPLALRQVLRSRRMIKSERELGLLRSAAHITDEAFGRLLEVIEPGVSEAEVAMEIERFMRSRGAQGVSFETVVASGHRSAMPHGVASEKVIASGELVTIDMGALVGGYHADMTRTVAVGEIPDELVRVYGAVLEAEEAALASVAAGVSGRELDEVAREVLRRHDLAQHFAHSLGHGVGLEIHEGPALSQNSGDLLEAGMTVTIEPGCYIAGLGGVRIEDLVVVGETGGERLSHSPKELIIL